MLYNQLNSLPLVSPLSQTILKGQKYLRSILEKYYLSILSVVLLGFFWELLVYLISIPVYILPPPSRILNKLITTPTLFYHAAITLEEIILGFLLGASLGISIASLMVRFNLLEKIAYPLLIASQSFPKEAFAPILLIWLGYGIIPKIVIAALIPFFPIVVTTIKGLTSADFLALELMRSMAASEKNVFFKLRLPSALPYILAGLKGGIILSIVGAIVGEFVGAGAGLGHVMIIANSQLATDLSFAALLLLGLMGIISYSIISFIEKKLLYWMEDEIKQ